MMVPNTYEWLMGRCHGFCQRVSLSGCCSAAEVRVIEDVAVCPSVLYKSSTYFSSQAVLGGSLLSSFGLGCLAGGLRSCWESWSLSSEDSWASDEEVVKCSPPGV